VRGIISRLLKQKALPLFAVLAFDALLCGFAVQKLRKLKQEYIDDANAALQIDTKRTFSTPEEINFGDSASLELMNPSAHSGNKIRMRPKPLSQHFRPKLPHTRFLLANIRVVEKHYSTCVKAWYQVSKSFLQLRKSENSP